ncbi:MAG: NTP transferase domain-containing protein [Vicinamibacteria bacterium]|nr:NTP transferase domain-containing protein [Vicinamibacteria bacterium]
MRVVAVIPARGGSDRVPYLNIRRLGDAPLLAHTIRAAREAKGIDRIIVSTDDDTVAEIARAHGAEVPFLRPKELSGDLSSLMPVVRHAVTESEKDHPRLDVVLVLQATTPFRTARSIDEALAKIATGRFSAVVSVTSDLSLRWKAEDGLLRPLFDRAGRRDEQEPVYLENGAIVAISRDVLDRDARFGDAVGFVVLDKREGFAVHDLEDFWMAERLLREPRILFRVDGSRVRGMGHVYRSLAVAEALRESSRAEIAFLMSADHAEGIATVSKSGYPVRVFKSGGLEVLIDSIQDFAPSVVINDLPLVEETYLRSLARLGTVTINLVDTLDDLERVSRDAQFVISVMNEDRETPEGFYGGPAFAILRRHFQGRERVFREKPARILLTFGGADPQGLTLKVAKALAPLTRDVEVLSVAGPAFPHTHVFEALQRTLGQNLPLVKGVDTQMADLMLGADLVLCSGGMSVYEIAALGAPGVVLAQNAREDRRMREFSRFGTIEYLGLGVDVDETAILDAVRQLLNDPERRREMSGRGRALVDGYGAARAAEIVLEQAQGQVESNGKSAMVAAREGQQ